MHENLKKWQVLEESLIEDFGLFSLKKSKRKNPKNGNPFTFLLMDGLDWTNIIALTPDNKIVLVQQQRQGSNNLSLELPGGCIEKGESPVSAIERELLEETGYVVERLEALGSLHANPALQSMKVHYFVGYQARKIGATKFDEGEDINCLELELEHFLNAVKSGKIQHSLMVAAVALFLLKDK